LNGLHRHLEIGPAQGSVSRSVPKFKHGLDLFEKQVTDDAGFATSIHEGLEIAFQVCPTHLTSQWVQPQAGQGVLLVFSDLRFHAG
jgi:hypothetical protein